MTTPRVGQRRVHLPSLAAELPDGWSVSERATYVSPTGAELHVRLEVAPEGLTASELAERSERMARDELAVIRSVEASTVEVRGNRVAQVLRFGHERGGVAGSARIMCVVEGACALTITALWAADEEDPSAEMDDLLGGIRILSRPPLQRDPRADPDAPARAPARRPPVDDAVWAELRTAWTQPQAAEPPERHPSGISRWSQEELAVGATIVGAPSFPTVGVELLGGLTEPELQATLAAVTRSFLARGLVRADDGHAVLDDALRQIVELAVAPDLSVAIDRFAPIDARRSWIGVRPDAAVHVVACDDGARACAHLAPQALVAQILADAGCGGSATAGGDGRSDGVVVPLGDITAGSGEVAALVSISTAWRSGEQIMGGLIRWAVGHDGRWWFADLDATPGSAVLEPADVVAMRAQLLEHLPGA